MNQNNNNTWDAEQDENADKINGNQEEFDSKIMDKSGYQHLQNEGLPTLTHGLVTTVPQNLANFKLGDKHAPTRNSLRHSRMIVLNKAPRVPIEFLPPIITYHDRAKTVMWIILIIGIIMSFQCSSQQIYAPNSRPQLNPFYTAVPILLSGIFGFVHLTCCRKEYPGLRRNACEGFIKIFSITTSIVASVTSSVYVLNGLIHLVSFFYLDCAPPDSLTATCICRLEDKEMVNSILNNSWNYVDLSCFELFHVFNAIIGLTSFTCFVIICLEIYYLSLHWGSFSRRKREKRYDFI
ncbi:uncharacterized protein LOC123672236 [Harmonia axyridis]|uniref:uncharacterized protein LOC123672236 n=1 Tax=Harmonia axyridis TaxID=115357 RepID=UPI001E27693A|nr:uncharacterized protein LOC123672236 [Harmonia axyridis]XP_045462212.1 uncharacterized protein LOC123672236 [Harmonia axyridis]XP_045462213.1 uncharacterized protein LOC123672236 [Harmonia axyridis]XP_045462214.1 uncharacterized protein LOC123672236 [Harmonia axyridis]